MQKIPTANGKITLFVICFVVMVATIVFLRPQTASADMGPKPSINITFDNLGKETCFVTILSSSQYSGPFSVYDPEADNKELGNYDSNYYGDENYVNEEAEMSWQAFVDYEDEDGYCFLQLWWKLGDEITQIRWSYHPPYNFKVLLYYPQSESFVSSDICERYAFDSYYYVIVNDVDGKLTLINSYDYSGEILGLICRIILTIAMELLIALLFRLKGRWVLLTIFAVNSVTQIALNVVLNLINYFEGALAYLVFFILLEIAVTIVEAVAYALLLRKADVPIWKSILYAVVANAATAVAGFFFAELFPAIF